MVSYAKDVLARRFLMTVIAVLFLVLTLVVIGYGIKIGKLTTIDVILYILILASVAVIFAFGRSTYGDVGMGVFAIATAVQVFQTMSLRSGGFVNSGKDRKSMGKQNEID
jgi:hypothetical protein